LTTHRRIIVASILAFPRKFFAETPTLPSPSAEEAAFNRPSFGLHLGSGKRTPFAPTAPSLEMTSQIGLAVAHIDREIAHYNARLRLVRLLIQQQSTTTLPA
jgi:hypothetical protein